MAGLFTELCTGWFGLHYVSLWTLLGISIFTLWTLNKRDREERIKRMKTLKEITENEQKVISSMKDLPAWVFFPDVHRAEWLNEIIAQMWPFVGKMVREILKEKVEPAMKKKLPGIVKSLHFEKISLGNLPPKIGGIKVYTNHVDRSEIIMDMDVIYAGDAVVKVNVKGITAGISDIHVRGKLRVVFNPLLPVPPLVGGMAFYFMDVPDIDFDLTNLLNVLDIPGLSNILRSTIKDVLSSFLVLPNRIKIPISKDADLEALKYPMPDGVLRIEIIEADKLIATDKNVFSKDSSDPYVVITVGAETYETKVNKETLSPKWNETFEIFVDSVQGRKVNIRVCDKDFGSEDKNLGKTELDLLTIARKGFSDIWLPLHGVESGEIHLKCTWFTFSTDPADIAKVTDEDNLATAAFFLKLDSAKDLPSTDLENETSSPYCKITVGNITEESEFIQSTKKPVWEELFRFLVHDPTYQHLHVKILDEHEDTTLGQLNFAFHRLLKDKDMRLSQPFPLQDANANSTMYLILEMKALVCKQKTDEKPEVENEGLRRRHVGKESFGEVEAAFKWDSTSNKLFVIVEKARNLTSSSEDDIVNPLIQMQLLPDKSIGGFRQSSPIKNSKNPTFEQEFDYFIGYDEIKTRTLDLSIANSSADGKEKQIIGHVLINLADVDLIKPNGKWYQLKEPSEDKE